MKQNERFQEAESRDNASMDSAETKKKSSETQFFFARLVRENKSTIYTVCYMFSHDDDEVNDLFQETLINMWKGIDSFREMSVPRLRLWPMPRRPTTATTRKRAPTTASPFITNLYRISQKFGGFAEMS